MLAQHPHDVTLPTFTKLDIKAQAPERRDARNIAQSWLNNLSSLLTSNDISKLPALFHNDSWWRDFLTLTWDLRTIRSLPSISSFLRTNLPHTEFSSFRLEDSPHPFSPHYETPIEGLDWIVSLFHFETKVGRGKGVLRLAQGDDGVWKAHFLSTTLMELKGYEELAGTRRKHGGNNALDGTSGGMKGGLNWQEKRDREKEFLDADPDVFVVGAGQSGLNVAARLQALNMSVLIVDKNERVGDNWRHRYRTLVTHGTSNSPYLHHIVRRRTNTGPRSRPIHTHGLHALPLHMAPLHAQRQARRLVRTLRLGPRAQHLDLHHHLLRLLLRRGSEMERHC